MTTFLLQKVGEMFVQHLVIIISIDIKRINKTKKSPKQGTFLLTSTKLVKVLRGWELNPACEIMSLTCSRTLPRMS